MPKDRYYNPNTINFIFAISSLILLGALGFMFMKDNDREWKKYQVEFQQLEIEKARVKYDAAAIDLDENVEYQELLADTDKIAKETEAHCQKLDEVAVEIEMLTSENILLQQKLKFARAKMDAAKYRFEESIGHGTYDRERSEWEFQLIKTDVDVLAKKVETSDTLLKQKKGQYSLCESKQKEFTKQKRKLEGQRDVVLRKLKKIDPNEMSFVNQIAGMIRNLPVLDLANPTLKIEQLVLKDIRDDVNFMAVPKVERCITCHLGVANPDYKDAVQPYKTHPNIELFMGKDSDHPLEEFGCTVCHGGRGRGTSFNQSVHTPSSEAQKKEWIKKYNWEKMELWEDPMLPLPNTQAGCFKCHTGQSSLKGGEKLTLGLQLIETAGCYSCHMIDKYKDWPKPGPDLTKIAGKIDKKWAVKWIKDPQSFRHNTWMPSYFNQSNNSDPVSVARSDQEILSIVHYLFNKSSKYDPKKSLTNGSAKKGEELVKSIGCMACHNIKPKADAHPEITNDSMRQEFGPNLIELGSKVNKKWLFDWLKDPNRYHPETRMPNLRLTDKEASDIAEYLIQDKNATFDKIKAPVVNADILNDIVLGFLKRSDTIKNAKEKLAKMSLSQKQMFTGEKLIGQYGCYSCHNIKGFENAKPIGVELTHEGDKDIHKFDFGFVHIEHTKPAWIAQKLRNPRSFDKDKLKAPDEKLVMPNFNFNEQEIEAITTAVLGFVDKETVKDKIYPRTPENILQEKGEDLVRQFNCQSCHNINEVGGSVSTSITAWLKEFEGKSDNDADKITESFSPPNLHGVGTKLVPEWLFAFLHSPTQKIRPWMQVRMPTFNFNQGHLNMLVKYFNSLENAEFPFENHVDVELSKSEYSAAEKLFSQDYFGCTQCHVVGNKMPSGTQDTWAPNLGLANGRLRPNWLIDWIKNPQAVMPGTKMPNFFDPDDYENSGPPDILNGDEDEQLRVLRNYILSLTPDTKFKTPPPPAPPKAKPAVTP